MKGSNPNSPEAGAINWLRRCDGGVNKKQKQKQQLSSSSYKYCDISWDDLAPQILKNLPIKSLCRFKCVSKFWRSIIIHHLAQQLVRQPIIIKQCSFSDTPEIHGVVRLCSIDGQTGLANHICTSPYLGTYLSPNFANGLFCYYDACRDTLGLCNPMTQENILLRKNSKCFSKGLSFGFGFDPISNQYKLLAYSNYPVCQIYTLGTTSWRQIRSTLPHDCGKPFVTSVCIHGTMYWYSDADMVISFELANESFGTIQGPQRLTRGPRSKGYVLYLFEFEGCLGLTDSHVGMDILDLWMLKDCNADAGCNNWVMVTSVASPSKDLRWTRPYSTGNGELVLAYYAGSPKVLYLYSLLKQQFDVIKVVGLDTEFIITANYAKSSLSLRDL